MRTAFVDLNIPLDFAIHLEGELRELLFSMAEICGA